MTHKIWSKIGVKEYIPSAESSIMKLAKYIDFQEIKLLLHLPQADIF